MEFFRQEYWSGLPFPAPGDLPDPGIKSAVSFGRWILYHHATSKPHRPFLWTFHIEAYLLDQSEGCRCSKTSHPHETPKLSSSFRGESLQVALFFSWDNLL